MIMIVSPNVLLTVLLSLLVSNASSFGIVAPTRNVKPSVVATPSFLRQSRRSWQLGFQPDDSELEFAEYQKDDDKDDKIERMAAFLSIRLGRTVLKEQLKKIRTEKDEEERDEDKTSAKDESPPIILPPAGTEDKDSPKASDGPEETEKEPESKTGTATMDVPVDALQELEKTIEEVSEAQEKTGAVWQAAGKAVSEKGGSDVSDRDSTTASTTTNADKSGADDRGDEKSKDWDWKEVLEEAKQAPTKSEDSGSETKAFKKTYDDVNSGSKSKHSKAEKLKDTAEVMKARMQQGSVDTDEVEEEHDAERPSLMHKKEGDRNVALKDEFDSDDTNEPVSKSELKGAELLEPTIAPEAENPVVAVSGKGETTKKSERRTNVDLPETPPVISTAFGKPLPTVQEGLPPLRDESDPSKSQKKQTEVISAGGKTGSSADSTSLKAHAVAIDVAHPVVHPGTTGDESSAQGGGKQSRPEMRSSKKSLQEHAAKILFDLGLAEIHPNPSDPDYDHSQDDEFCPENRWKGHN